MRYFSVGHPTKLVRDGRTECYDEPPAESGDEPAPTATAVIAPAGRRGYTSAAGSDAQGSDTALSPIGDPPGPLVRRRRRGLEYVAVACGAVVAVLVFVALAGG